MRPRILSASMDAAVDLRSPRDRLMDSQIVRLEWIEKKEALWTPKYEPAKPEPPKLEPTKSEPIKPEPTKPPPVVRQLGPEEIATLDQARARTSSIRRRSHRLDFLCAAPPAPAMPKPPWGWAQRSIPRF